MLVGSSLKILLWQNVFFALSFEITITYGKNAEKLIFENYNH